MTKEWRRAVLRGLVSDVERLAAAGADINGRDRYGQTALMVAAREGHADLVRWLVDRGADLNHTAKFGLSALMLAALRGHAAIVQALVDAGADLTLRGTGAPGFHGKTALDLAVGRGDITTRDILHAYTGRAGRLPDGGERCSST